MDLSTFGFILHTMGEIIVALTVLSVHHRVKHEQKIDKKVFQSMRTEESFGILAIIFIVSGFVLQILY
ncbi:hypothetical protein COT97_05885 [Candidatus Falkowbacteria bacterium CG10_big_fil_rev_8_21_14_0_10_39_11]|uniref:Uncharacterized protein n=1 Tax=Candidatus Falkowbacteria bacterium CG10_big_fil_rev_8_21_14_0_10_39_11 TaxID=1974565 RepID=A0A2H0V590_9BACT|nr:MAG: hypothetical protein COT97_05885 [Candidatus Falkowbacteria bacterium CG10_big_fil_rev_8_21_14_0_10_39_11]